MERYFCILSEKKRQIAYFFIKLDQIQIIFKFVDVTFYQILLRSICHLLDIKNGL